MDDDDIMQPAPPDMAGLLTFADLVSLLITFFVLLYSMKVIDVQTWDELVGSFTGTFNPTKPIFEMRPDMDASEKFVPRDADPLDYLQTLLKSRFSSDPLLRNATFGRDPVADTLTVQLPSTLLFESGNATLKPEGRQAILKLGDLMRHLDNRMDVAGHTDPIPIESRTITNWELAMDRAWQVTSLLTQQGVPGPITALSFADSRFENVAPDLPLAERLRKARRVEIIVHSHTDG